MNLILDLRGLVHEFIVKTREHLVAAAFRRGLHHSDGLLWNCAGTLCLHTDSLHHFHDVVSFARIVHRVTSKLYTLDGAAKQECGDSNGAHGSLQCSTQTRSATIARAA